MPTARLWGVIPAMAACMATGAQDPPDTEAIPSKPVVRFEPAEDDAVRVLIGDAHFTTLVVSGAAKPYLYPLLGPGGQRVTRGYPIESRPGEATDHPHHTSLWFAHGDVNGRDFWHGPDGERIVATAPPAFDDATDTITARFQWRAADGDVVCTEERRMRFAGDDRTRLIDFDLRLTAIGGKVTFGDTKEGTFAVRLAPTLRLEGEVAEGSCRNSAGQTDGQCWGKRARWVEYGGPVDGGPIGIAIFDHPSNPRHPTWWHARDYGLFAANPFGIHDFEGRPEGTGDLTLPKGRTLRFRYRLLIHEGVWTPDRLESAYREFAGSDQTSWGTEKGSR